MKIYAYKITDTGREPTNPEDKLLYELKTIKGGVRRAIKILGENCRVYIYRNFYDKNTFEQIY